MPRTLQLERRTGAAAPSGRRGLTGGAGPARRPLAIVLHDVVAAEAPADEQDTLVQAAAVQRALRTLGYRVQSAAFRADLCDAARRLRDLAPDLVFNLVESVGSDARLIHLAPAVLEGLQVPFTGCGASAMLATSNKIFAKRALAGAGVPTPAWLEANDFAGAQMTLPGSYIVKSVWEHASIGLAPSSIASTAQDLMAIARERRERFGGEWFAERFIDGREFNLSLLAGPDGPEVLPIAEMRFVDFPEDRPRIVDYTAKWCVGSFEYQNTRRSFEFSEADRPLLGRLRTLALRCWSLFRLNGYARVDFRVDGDGKPWVLEVNANPCLSPDAGFVAAVERAGLDLVSAVARILADCPAHQMARQASRERGPAPGTRMRIQKG